MESNENNLECTCKTGSRRRQSGHIMIDTDFIKRAEDMAMIVKERKKNYKDHKCNCVTWKNAEEMKDCPLKKAIEYFHEMMMDEFSIDLDPIYNPETGEIFRKRKWVTKEEAMKMFPKTTDEKSSQNTDKT